MRARGAAIPVASDFTPNWGGSNGGHEWGAIITKSGSIPFNMPVKDCLGEYKRSYQIPSKVYRNTFSENKESHAKQRGPCEFLPALLNNPILLDVTNLYMPTNDISIPVLLRSDRNKFVYLAASNRDKWPLVGWGKINNGLTYFTKVCCNSIYLPVFASNSGVQPFNYPFILSDNGEVRYFKPNLKNLQRVELI